MAHKKIWNTAKSQPHINLTSNQPLAYDIGSNMEDKTVAKYSNEQSRESARKYLLKNSYSIAFRLSKVYEQDLIDIYNSIPKSTKAEWFKQCLREYGEKHKQDGE